MSEIIAKPLDMSLWMKARVGARLMLLQARWDSARMQGTGLAFALDPWLNVCWASEPAGLLAARRRHLEYFNTNPIAAWLVAGIICRQEAAAAALLGAPREAAIVKIHALKAGLAASLAGLYDSFFWGALRPVSALAGLLAAQAAYRLGSPHAPAWAASTALLVYNIPALSARAFGLMRGAAVGDQAVAELARLSVQPWILNLRRTTIAGALAAFVFGGLLGGGDRIPATLTFAAGMILTWRGISPLAQLGFAGLGGMASSAAGLWP